MQSIRLGALALLVAFVAVPTAHAGVKRCAVPRHATVIAERGPVAWSTRTDAGSQWYACTAARARPIAFAGSDEPYSTTVVSHVRLAGRWLAYARIDTDHYLDGPGARIVAFGPRGTLKGLRLIRSRGEWTESGRPHSARLHGTARCLREDCWS